MPISSAELATTNLNGKQVNFVEDDFVCEGDVVNVADGIATITIDAEGHTAEVSIDKIVSVNGVPVVEEGKRE
jgi:hypothetical protein